jgi:hypothetical protein
MSGTSIAERIGSLRPGPTPRRRRTLATLALALLAAAFPKPCHAFLPRVLPDEQLAGLPIIVVAHWPRIPMRRVQDPRLIGAMRTSLIVDRVLKGAIARGPHTLL